MKKWPLDNFCKKSGLKPITGVMAGESNRRSQQYKQRGCNFYSGKKPISAPMSFWRTDDVLEYILSRGLDYCSEIYGDIGPNADCTGLVTTGEERTGCIFCMFGVHLDGEPNRFQRLKLSHPKLWKYCVEDLKCGGVLDHMGIPYG